MAAPGDLPVTEDVSKHRAVAVYADWRTGSRSLRGAMRTVLTSFTDWPDDGADLRDVQAFRASQTLVPHPARPRWTSCERSRI
jgi:hypothetical protein